MNKDWPYWLALVILECAFVIWVELTVIRTKKIYREIEAMQKKLDRM